jgi:hypothetical protein
MSHAEALRLLYRTQFSSFYRFAHRQVYGNEPLDNWHIDYFFGLMENCLSGKKKRIVINAPPPHLETFLIAVALPVFALGQNPKRKILVLVETKEIAKELEQQARLLMGATQMPALFSHLAALAKRPKLQVRSGGRLTYAVYGRPIIERDIDIAIVLSPISAADASNDSIRAAVNQWFNSDLIPRLTDRSNAILVAMQRLHDEDLTGMLLSNKGVWSHTEFVAMATQDEEWRFPNGNIFRRAKGEVLHPERMSKDELLAILEQIDAVQFSAQYQQDTSVHNNRRRWQWTLKDYDDAWYENWTPECGIESWTFGYLPEIEFMRYELFGVGPPPPKYFSGRLTSAQWEQAGILHQRKLIESMQGD